MYMYVNNVKPAFLGRSLKVELYVDFTTSSLGPPSIVAPNLAQQQNRAAAATAQASAHKKFAPPKSFMHGGRKRQPLAEPFAREAGCEKSIETFFFSREFRLHTKIFIASVRD